ncbi:hypothetical protein PR202_ga25713 [Eleusine coracana subsp. coracana]|uniref:Uncharacterized protein n=1 Tax=Eleusine coracana subsp. coracana TaxID=191504 RepID=A0AAV5DC96_ELECO|nr:hypothetical protein PR202_ga25713 [Eleusine coracana subsp. coracana]
MQVSAAGGHGDDGQQAVDFRGNPVDKSRTGGWLGAGLILGTELAERVCVMGISMNLVTVPGGRAPPLQRQVRQHMVTNFMGTLNLLALLGGFLADAKLGRYLTIAISAAVAATGVTLLTVDTTVPGMRPPPCVHARGARSSECVAASGGQLALLYAALYTIAAGGGGLKANVSGFGSDQFDGRDPREERAMVFFFNRFYFCISLGSLFAVTVLVYVQDNVGRGWGYGVSAVAMVLAAVAVFVAGHGQRRMATPADPAELNGFHAAKVAYTDRLRCLDKAAIVEADLSAPAEKQSSAPAASTVTEVEEVKMVATRMDRHLRPGSTSGFVIPAGSLSVFLFISILLFTSLNERLLVPLAARLTGRRQGLTSLQRVGTGLVFAVVAMAVSALVERMRRDAANDRGEAISAFWLVPQFFLVGAGEAFAYVGQLEFFIREAPRADELPRLFAVDAVTKGAWIRNNLDAGKLDLFYWMLAVLGVVNFAVFLVFSRRHVYKPSTVAAAVAPAAANGEENREMDDFIAVKETVEGMDV